MKNLYCLNQIKRSAIAMSILGSSAFAGQGAAPTEAFIIEGSAFFGAPGIELGVVGKVSLADPSITSILSTSAVDLRFGGADIRPGSSDLIGFENTTNALRILDTVNGGNTLIDSIGYMASGVAGMSYSNDGAIAYVTTTVGGFARIVEADANTGAVLEVHNLFNLSLSSLATVPDGHPTLNPGDLYGLGLTGTSSLKLMHIDLTTNSIVSQKSILGIGFTPQFETGLDWTSDGDLYGIIQGFDETSPGVFVEVSSHLYTIDPASGNANDLGVIQSHQTWDAVTLVIDDGIAACKPDLTGDGTLDFFDISAFLTAFGTQDPVADFTGDRVFDFFDISVFLSVFGAGCP